MAYAAQKKGFAGALGIASSGEIRFHTTLLSECDMLSLAEPRKLCRIAELVRSREQSSQALLTATKYSNKIIDRIVDIPDKPGDLGLVFTTLTLMRSKRTLRACRILLKLGHGAESFVIARLLLEQVAWIYASHQSKTPEELESITASRAVKRLSRLMPIVGRLYGYLSDVAHINPRHTRQYLRVSDGPMQVITAGAARDKLRCAKILLHLVDVQTIVAEHVYADHLPTLETISKNVDGTLAIRADRPFVAEVEKHASQLASFADDDTNQKGDKD